MIRINIIFAISLYTYLWIFLVFGFWLLYNKKQSSILHETTFLRQCDFCTYIFYNFKKGDMSTCPKCKSYIKNEFIKFDNNNKKEREA